MCKFNGIKVTNLMKPQISTAAKINLLWIFLFLDVAVLVTDDVAGADFAATVAQACREAATTPMDTKWKTHGELRL